MHLPGTRGTLLSAGLRFRGSSSVAARAQAAHPLPLRTPRVIATKCICEPHPA